MKLNELTNRLCTLVLYTRRFCSICDFGNFITVTWTAPLHVQRHQQTRPLANADVTSHTLFI